jgi:predicted acyl esterase
LPYRIRLPNADHTFLPGHRIMVQVQSSWFPLYDRNPQTFVPNIMFAPPESFVKATQRIWHTPDQASAIELPVITDTAE